MAQGDLSRVFTLEGTVWTIINLQTSTYYSNFRQKVAEHLYLGIKIFILFHLYP